VFQCRATPVVAAASSEDTKVAWAEVSKSKPLEVLVKQVAPEVEQPELALALAVS